MRATLSVGVLGLVLFLAACTGATQPTSSPALSSEASVAVSPSSSALPPVDSTIRPVSGSSPSPAAADAMAKCNVGTQIPVAEVTGMGQLPDASRLPHYVPLTGREPQLKQGGPVWVVTVQAEIPQPGSGEVWIDPTCIVTPSDAGWFATGPVYNTRTKQTLLPEVPPIQPDLRVPPLEP